MKLSFVLLAAVSFAVAAPALADDAKPAQPPKEKKICRRETVTGSIVGFRSVCHTKDEWSQIDATNAQGVDNTIGNGRTPK